MTTIEQELEKNGYIVRPNVGTSMLPLLRQGRDLMVIKAQKGGYKKGDAVLFKRDNGQYLLHRITKKNADGTFVIVGDNRANGDKSIRENQLLGLLVEVKRDGKSLKITDFRYKLYLFYVPVQRFFLSAKKKLLLILAKAYHLFVKK